jgi:hypothetical protein
LEGIHGYLREGYCSTTNGAGQRQWLLIRLAGVYEEDLGGQSSWLSSATHMDRWRARRHNIDRLFFSIPPNTLDQERGAYTSRHIKPHLPSGCLLMRPLLYASKTDPVVVSLRCGPTAITSSFFLPLSSSAVLSIYFMTFYVAIHLMMTNKAVNRNVTK